MLDTVTCTGVVLRSMANIRSQQRTAERILQQREGVSLRDFLANARSAGGTYESISQELYATTDRAVSVSYQTIKRWLSDFDLLDEVAS